MIFLAIDIGNSNTVMVLFRNSEILGEWRFASSPSLRTTELREHLGLFLRETRIPANAIGGTGISSVVPPLTRTFIRTLRGMTKLEPMVISGKLPVPVRLRYDDPGRLGADRICGIVAAREKAGRRAVIVADFGTATTYDVLSAGGLYLGGAIAPGVGISAEALSLRTAALPIPALEFPRSPIGRNTLDCLKSGILFGAVDAFEGMIRRLRETAGASAPVIATGGFAGLIASQSKLVSAVEPYLVPEGIRAIYSSVIAGRKRLR